MTWRPAGRLRARHRVEQNNAWVTCPKHGGYNPYYRTLAGSTGRHEMCPTCALEIAEEAREARQRDGGDISSGEHTSDEAPA